MPGVANKLGARFTDHVATSFPGTPLRHATYSDAVPADDLHARPGRPPRRGPGVVRARDDLPALLVTGGAGAPRSTWPCRLGPVLRRRRRPGAARDRPAHEVSSPATGVPYVVVGFVDRMDLAYSAADAVLCRSGSTP